MAAQDWSRFGRSTAVPILLLVGLLVILGHLHIDLAHGYTAPRVVADDQSALIFYDEGGRDASFSFRQSDDGGKTWSKRRRVHGALASAALTKERIVGLLAGAEDEPTKVFYSTYARKTLERLWSGDLQDPDLGLAHPRHVTTLGDAVLVFGTDKQGDLRVARLSDDGKAVVPLAVSLPRAAIVPDPPPDSAGKVPPPVAWASTVDQGKLLLFWRVVRDPAAPRSGGEVRWTSFDGAAFGTIDKAREDLVAFAAVTVADGAGRPPRPLLFAQRATEGDGDAPAITVLRLGAADLEIVEQVDYEREGLTRSSGVAALSVAVTRGRTLLVAQIGGAIRVRGREATGAWGPWEDVARLPAEQRLVVYGWGASLLALSGALIVLGLRTLRARSLQRAAARPRDLAALCEQALEVRRSERAEAPPPAAEAEEEEELPEAAPLTDRALAFVVDLGVVTGVATCAAMLAPATLVDRLEDPRARLALAACFMAGVLLYFIVFEALFARTPGKRLLNLEVQTLEGGRPSLGALVFRNLFRIELLVPPPYLTLLVSVAVMLVSPQHQRPGDLVARTAVRRSRA